MYFIGTSTIQDGAIAPLSDQQPIGLDGEIYELFRVEKGKALFLSDHLERLRNTLISNKKALPDYFDRLPSLIEWLIVCNLQQNCDVRICLTPSGTLQAGFVPSDYPTEKMYTEGVHCELLKAIRQCPNSKIYHAKMRSDAGNQQVKTGAYESVLVDEEGKITEGSRSNIFFVKDGELFTAPDEKVLGGIMRKKVLELAAKCQIIVNFVAIEANDVGQFDGAFLSSTPMRILPINKLSEHFYSVNVDVVKLLAQAMRNEIEQQTN